MAEKDGYNIKQGTTTVVRSETDVYSTPTVIHEVNPSGEEVYEISSSKTVVNNIEVNQHTDIKQETAIRLGTEHAEMEFAGLDENKRPIYKPKENKDGSIKRETKKVKLNGMTQYDGSSEGWKTAIEDKFLDTGTYLASAPITVVRSLTEGAAMAVGEHLADQAVKAIFKEKEKEHIEIVVKWGHNVGDNLSSDIQEFDNIRKIQMHGVSEENGILKVKVKMERKLGGNKYGFSAMTGFVGPKNLLAQNLAPKMGAAASGVAVPQPKVPNISDTFNMLPENHIRITIKGFKEGGLLEKVPSPLGGPEIVYEFSNIEFTQYYIGISIVAPDEQMTKPDMAVETIEFTGYVEQYSADAPRIIFLNA